MTQRQRRVSVVGNVRRRFVVRTVAQADEGKHMAKSHLKLVTPAIINRTVTPKRLPNAALRTREYLTEAEVERLMTTARKNRWGHRDATMSRRPRVGIGVSADREGALLLKVDLPSLRISRPDSA